MDRQSGADRVKRPFANQQYWADQLNDNEVEQEEEKTHKLSKKRETNELDYYLETEIRGFLEPRIMTEYTSSKVLFLSTDEENISNRLKDSKGIRPRT